MSQAKNIFFVMGVAGCGKTLIGNMLSKEWSLPFFDADDFHSEENRLKMSDGVPLNDADRHPWLKKLNEHAKNYANSGCIIACSALKESYRRLLSKDLEHHVQWIYLHGSYDVILERLQNRSNHYMGAEMLQSQYADLEEPKNAICMEVILTPEAIVKDIKHLMK